jgi:hypothetical protein
MRIRTSLLLVVALVSWCDSGGSAPQPTTAAPEKSPEDVAREKIIAEANAKREAEKKAEEEAEKKALEQIDALTVLPEKMPKKLEAACDGRNDAEDKFMTSHFPGEGAAKWEAAKTTQLAMRRKDCLKQPIEVAACEINALGKAPVELKSRLPDLLRVCREKFAQPAPG